MGILKFSRYISIPDFAQSAPFAVNSRVSPTRYGRTAHPCPQTAANLALVCGYLECVPSEREKG